MDLRAAISGDFDAVVDGLEAATLRRGGTSGEISRALRNSKHDAREAVRSNGLYVATFVDWRFSSTSLPFDLRLGDSIVDAQSREYVVKDFEQNSMTNTVTARTVELSIVAPLLGEITAYERGARTRAGSPTNRRVPWRSAVPTRVVVSDQGGQEYLGEGLVPQPTAYVRDLGDGMLPLPPGARLLVGGVLYDVEDVVNLDDLAGFVRLDLRIVPPGEVAP